MNLATLIFVLVCGVIAWVINDKLKYDPEKKWIGQVIILAIGLVYFANLAGINLGLN